MQNIPHAAWEQTPAIVPAILPLLSHELRTPLTAIKGFAALLLRYHERLHPGEQLDMIAEIGLACERLEKTIAAIIQMGEMVAGQVDFAPVVLDLAHLLREAVAFMQQQPDDSAHAQFSLSIECSDLLIDEVNHISLAHCRLIAALHDGLLWIESRHQHEHTLHLVLPAWS